MQVKLRLRHQQVSTLAVNKTWDMRIQKTAFTLQISRLNDTRIYEHLL